METLFNVKGKVAIVTGAADGLGRAIAQTFVENGMKVVIADINEEKGSALAEELTHNGGTVVFVKTDVSSEADMENLVAITVEKFGKLDGIVNNAGIAASYRPTHEYTVEEYDRLTAINLKSVFLGMKYGVKGILKSKSTGGFVINVASMAGILGNAGMGLYTASKHGVVGYTKTAALEYAMHQITVNAICPGTFKTGIWTDTPEEKIQEVVGFLSANGRLGDPKEVGYLALFLASDLSRFISGAAIPIDSGAGVGKMMPLPWEDTSILE
ncbi:MAG: SDR family NAD(P)-dependent oxidoreductase [Candidatus Pristimantibacillus sp.]